MMTRTTDVDGVEDVNDFLLRIRELGEKRDKEDEERTKKLEEEILQGRKERQARRAERARSISPTKDSPLLDVSRLSASSLDQRSIDPPEFLEPSTETADHETTSPSESHRQEESAVTDDKSEVSKIDETGMSTSPRAVPAAARSRTGTLSWQQRPSSRDLNKPLVPTFHSRENSLKTVSTANNDDHEPSRSQPANSRTSKDPSWFRQTPDRGVGSPALRPNTDGSPPDTTPTFNLNQKLPGMSPESAKDPEKPITHDVGEDRSSSPSRASSTFGEGSLAQRFSSMSSVSTTGGLGSPIPLSSAQKFEARTVEHGTEDQNTTSLPSSPRRASPERSISPTKGLGGFVQSAMMKRSDSVSKRWSAQLPPGLSRTKSIASNRNSIASPALGDLASATTAPKVVREGSSLALSRPGSSHSEATIVHHTKEGERPSTPPVPGSSNHARSDEGFARPPLPTHSRPSSAAGNRDQSTDSTHAPTSPFYSRTMDPKRWSPTKATWLESALNRPESPGPKKQPQQQPPWMRERQSRGSVDFGRPSSFKEVTPVGLMRTPPPGSHYKKPSVSGIPDLPNLDTSRSNEPTPAPSPDAKARDPPPAEEKADVTLSTSDNEEPAMEKESEQETKNETTESATEIRKRPPLSLSPKPNLPISPLSPKPRTQSPVVDFRANLRRREIVKEDSPKEEPEFKNVFGKLKKTETSSYVPPDELKNNILKGKAALNATAGPKKTQRVDELKERILKQKEAMKAGGGSVRRNTVTENNSPVKPESPVLEAIAKRNNLSKSTRDDMPSPSKDLENQPGSHEQRQSSPGDREAPSSPEQPQAAAISASGPTDPEAQIADDKVINKAITECQEAQPNGENEEAKQIDSAEKTMEPVRALPSGSVAAVSNAAAATEGLATKGTLAGRINPALAGLLSRGPPIAGGGPRKSISTDSSEQPSSTSIKPSNDSTSGAPLTHMTKQRARGPKRRLPKATKNDSPSAYQQNETKPPSPVSPSLEVENPEAASSPIAGAEKASIEGDSIGQARIAASIRSQAKPSVIGKPEESGQDLNIVNEEKDSAKPGGVASRLRSDFEKLSSRQSEDIPWKLEHHERGSSPSKFALPATSPSTPRPPQRQSPQVAYSSPSPSPLRTSLRENMMDSPIAPQHKSISGSVVKGPRDMSPRNKALPSPPVPPKNDIAMDTTVDLRGPSSKMSSPSPVPQTSEARETISMFFTTLPKSSDRVDIDPQLMLTSRKDDLKIRTLKRQIWEITGDGKRQDLPVNQEYILYEGSMYLCVHVFEVADSTRSEVHLWCGDDVGEAAMDDAQLFARKVARENSCKLEVLKQGKETARFIEALGGIIITRRGSSSRSSSSALYMLCGRRHLGQMAFDEVDFSRRNLCSGYPFVISARFGNLYLWKGRGSRAEEIGAARLIGMDLGLTGEIEEVAEGKEPESFFEVFPDYREGTSYVSSDHWRLKPNHEHFCFRLLRVDHELGQRQGFWMRRPGSSSPVIRPNDTVQEIEPFCQKDLATKGIYVLDTFFEIYVIVGEQASSRPAEFASAVVFAHEYGILSASLQDRPFIPKSFVAIGGIPESCLIAFRKWDKRSWQTPPKVLPLNAAIEAIRS